MSDERYHDDFADAEFRQAIEDTIRIGEIELRQPLCTHRSRIEAVLAGVFSARQSGLLLGHCIRHAQPLNTEIERAKWARAGGRLLCNAYRGGSRRAAVARKTLLSIASYADAAGWII